MSHTLRFSVSRDTIQVNLERAHFDVQLCLRHISLNYRTEAITLSFLVIPFHCGQ